jgi:GntR family transcriptional regulator/MocR family aminotransferase
MTKHARSVLAQDVEGLNDTLALHVRVQDRIRSAIVGGNFRPAMRLPSSRTLARDFGVSRHTVEWAFANLEAEGFIERRQGAGTFVAKAPPERVQPPAGERAATGAAPDRVPSKRGTVIASYPFQAQAVALRAFVPSIPAHDLFPHKIWSRAMARALARSKPDDWAYGTSTGQAELRRAIAVHVAAARGVSCSPEQVIVVTSTQQGIDIAARVLCDEGEEAWIEEPGYPPIRHLLTAAGLRPVPVTVDAYGFDTEKAMALAPRARLACVTPSHQYPSGALMSLERRNALLDWARERKGWIIEDDYDGDFRYVGRPLAALQALDPEGRVIYIGTFNKTMFPALRIAYLVVPDVMVDSFASAKHIVDGFTSLHAQSALAAFIEDGHLAAHLRRMLQVYDERRRALIAAVGTLEGALELGPADAGMHAPAYLATPRDDRALADAVSRRGIDLRPLSAFYAGVPRQGFLLGFAAATPEQIARGMKIVGAALK